MKKSSIAKAAAALAAAAAVTASAREASAINCNDASIKNPVYVTGSSAAEPILARLNTILLAQNPPVTIVYQKPGSCAGLTAIAGTPTALTGTATYGWDGTFTANATCTMQTPGPNPDVGVSDVFPATCPNVTLAATQKEFQGPIQTMTFIVPVAQMTESAMSAEAAFAILGWAGTGMHDVAPWTKSTVIYRRNQNSGTQQMISAAIGLSAAKWVGMDAGGSGPVITGVGTTSAADLATLGIVATDQADAHRDKVKVLAYQHKGQSCGYLPDSTAMAKDKINVREGRYAIWGPLHLVTNVDGQGMPTGNTAASVIALINEFTRNGLAAADVKAAIDVEIAAHVIPQCAMKVARTSEIGAEMSFQPDVPCGCYFESQTGGASASCKTCTMDTDCTAAPNTHCRYGYCEAK